MAKNKKKSKEELSRPVTLGVLLQFTEEVLMPSIGKMFNDFEIKMDKKMDAKLKTSFAKHTYEMKSYFDDKLADSTSDIFKRLDKKYEKDKQFKSRVVDVFRRSNIGTVEDIAYLQGMLDAA